MQYRLHARLVCEQAHCTHQNRGLTRGSTLREINPSVPIPGDPWLGEFIDSLHREDLSLTTLQGYRNDLTAFVRWFTGTIGMNVCLDLLTEIDLMNYRQHLVNVKRLKPATVNRRLEALRRLCRWAYHRGILKTNVAEGIKAVRMVPRRQPIGLAEPEVHLLFRAAGQSKHGLAKRNYALVQIMIQAGLRIGETASLRICDAVIRGRTGELRIQGKGRKEREVPLNATARRALTVYLNSRDGPKPEYPLFVGERGKPMSVRAIQAVISNLVRRSKITRQKVSAHTLRHTFALSYLRQNPGQLVQLASLLGHDSLDTTAIYTRPSMEELADNMERSNLNVYDS